MDAKELLRQAAVIMERRGKTEGTYVDHQGKVCVYGALTLAATDEESADYAHYCENQAINAAGNYFADWLNANRHNFEFHSDYVDYPEDSESDGFDRTYSKFSRVVDYSDHNDTSTVILALREAAES